MTVETAAFGEGRTSQQKAIEPPVYTRYACFPTPLLAAELIPFESMCVFTLDVDAARLRSVPTHVIKQYAALQGKYAGLLLLPMQNASFTFKIIEKNSVLTSDHIPLLH